MFALLFVYMPTSYIYAQEEYEFDAPEQEQQCAPVDINIVWPEKIKTNQTAEYFVQSTDTDLDANNATFVSEVFDLPSALSTPTMQSFNALFDAANDFVLSTSVTIWDCIYQTTKTIEVYDRVTLYMGKWREELELNTALQEKNIRHLVESILLDSSQWSQQVLTTLVSNTQLIRIADEMILDANSPWSLLEAVWQYFKTQQIATASRWFYLISDVDQAIYRKIISRYLQVWWIEKINVVDPQYFGSLYTALLLQQDPLQFDYVKEYSANLDGVNKLFFVSYFVDYLLLNGFPLQLLILILVLPVVALLISFSRQVIGMWVFGLFGPLLFALSMSIMWWKLACVLLLAAVIAVVLTTLFTQRIYLLSSPKLASMLILYTLFAIFLFRVHDVFGLEYFTFDILSNSFVIFGYLAILITAKNLVTETVIQFKKWRWISLLEFVLLSIVIFYLVRRDRLQNIMLWYPELVVLIVFLNVIVGRFTWLQIKEYARFAPLIWYNLENEVEE